MDFECLLYHFLRFKRNLIGAKSVDIGLFCESFRSNVSHLTRIEVQRQFVQCVLYILAQHVIII